MKKPIGILTLICSCFASVSLGQDFQTRAYRSIGIDPTKVLSGTVLRSVVLPGNTKQVVATTTYLTGKKDKQNAVNVRLDVFEEKDGSLVSVYTRDIGAENGGNVGDGNLELIDLDMDGLNDIIISFDSFADPLIVKRLGEVILWDRDEGGFRTAWTGAVEYDATRAVREVPDERRDRFVRDFDLPKTLRAKGKSLFLTKKMITIAGERLSEPQLVEEVFPLRVRAGGG